MSRIVEPVGSDFETEIDLTSEIEIGDEKKSQRLNLQ